MKDILSEKDRGVIEDILTDKLDVQREQLTPGAHLEEDLGADSLTRVEIAMTIEDQFNFTLPDERWEKVITVGDVFETVAEAVQGQRS